MLFTSCGKEEPREVEVIMISADLVEDQIECRFEVLIDGLAKVSEVAGIYWGTGANPSKSGVKLSSYTASSGELKVIINNFDYSKTYYFQGYAIVDHVEHLSNVMYLPIGVGWKKLVSQPAQQCHNIAVAPNGTVHAVGSYGVHYYSADTGQTWNQITHTSSASMGYLKFISNDVAYMIAGSDFRKSMDGGMTWTTITNPHSSFDCVYFLDESTFFVSKNDSIFKTTNSGVSYNAAFAPNGGDYGSLFFLNSSTGFGLSTDGSVVKTVNGGASWTHQNPTSIYGYCNEIWFFDNLTGVVTTSDYVYRTTDGGVSWTNVADLNNQGLTMDFYDASHGAIGGNWGLLTQTQNAGLNWQVNYFPDENNHILSLDLLNETLGFAIDNAGQVIICQ